jgi:hypothetical protein
MMMIRTIISLLCVIEIALAGTNDKSNNHTNTIDKWNTDNECEILKKYTNDDGERLLNEYIKRDARGDFLKTDQWIDTAVECPNFVPGPDEFVLVRDFKIGQIKTSENRVQMKVRYYKIGKLSQNSSGSFLILDTTSFEVNVVAIRTDYGWRIKAHHYY